jgi:hemerythrin superfamily protein
MIMTDILINDHAEVDALLSRLTDAFEHADAREVLAKLDYFWARLAMHIRAEHLHLFPALLSASEKLAGVVPGRPTPGEVRESVERLREDHDFFMRRLAEAVNSARALIGEDSGEAANANGLRHIRDIVLAVAERLAEHNGREEEQVYLWPESLMSEAARADLLSRTRLELENVPPRFSDSVHVE